MCRGRDGKNLSEIIKIRWLKYFHYMQKELGSKGSVELKVLRILRKGEEIIGKWNGTKMYFCCAMPFITLFKETSRMFYE